MHDISLLNDLLFKIVFGNQKNAEALVGLLNGILSRKEKHRIVSVEILNPLRDLSRLEDKGCILDIRAKEANGSIYNVEMQVAKQFDYRERTLFYGCTMVSEQPIAGKKYGDLIGCVHISLVDFILFPNHQDVVSCFRLYDVEHEETLSRLLELYYIELKKLRYGKPEELVSSVQRWVYFLCNATSYQSFEELPQFLKQEEGMAMAYQATHEALCDQELLFELKARRKFQLDQSSNLSAAHDEGLSKGRSAAIRQGALSFQKQGLSLESIAAAFSISENELAEILAQTEQD